MNHSSSLTSLQPLGDARVLVEYESHDAEDGGRDSPSFPAYIEVLGALIGGDSVGWHCFADDVVARWTAAIEQELSEDAADDRYDGYADDKHDEAREWAGMEQRA